MMQFDRMIMGRKAKELGFVRDTYEKVCRLADILKFMEQDEVIADTLALKGGTAINLTIFNLPRLSVDIDLDFSKNLAREEMLAERETITSHISRYMSANGYVLSTKSKNYHALDSFVYEYQNAGGMKDNLKIEINYMLRSHILPVQRRSVELPWLERKLTVLSVAPVEIFGAKIVALLTRAAARDLYDVHNMVRYGLFDETEWELLRKCAVFYSAVGGEKPPEDFVLDNIVNVTSKKIKTDLYPVLRHGDGFELNGAQKEVTEYLMKLLIPTMEEKLFWRTFESGIYSPEYVFEGAELQNIKNHPMAIWKCQTKTADGKVKTIKQPKR